MRIPVLDEVAHGGPHSLRSRISMHRLLRRGDIGGRTDADGLSGFVRVGHVDRVVGASGAVGLHVGFNGVDGIEEGMFCYACNGACNAVVEER